MYEEGVSKQVIFETLLALDQQSLLRACSWIEPVLFNEIRPEDRVVAYRLYLNEDDLDVGLLDDDFHFRVRLNGEWWEKCGEDLVRTCDMEEDPWYVSPVLKYDSEIVYFRFKN